MVKVKKRYIIGGSLLFLAITIVALSTETHIGKVRFRNQSLTISQENANFTNTDIDINLDKTNIENKDIETNNTKINVENSQNIDNSNITFNNSPHNGELHDMKFENRAFTNVEDVDYSNQTTHFENAGGARETEARMQKMAKAIQEKKFEEFRQEQNRERDRRYKYHDISWNVWKSNFINKFLDDSLIIKSLDDYKIGTWFYYSFVVTNTGEIRDIKVKSFTLKEEDKEKIRDLIRSYAHKDITIFPANSQRETAKVDAIVVLGDSETKTKPSDFHDNERIKIEY